MERDRDDSGCVFGKDKYFILCLFNLFGYDMIYLWIHVIFLMKPMSYLSKKPLMEFNLFMQVNFVKELETSFWDLTHNLFEEMTI